MLGITNITRYNIPIMRDQPLPAAFHSTNRATLAQNIGDEAIAIIDTADKLVRRGDSEYPFRPDSNFYYLTGIDEPEAVLVLAPGQANAEARELLFVSGSSDHTALWEGDRHTPEQASARSGVKQVLPLADLNFYLDRLLARCQTVYLNAEESLQSVMSHPAMRRAAILRAKAPLHQYKSALPALDRQRTIKAEPEIAQIRRAIAITNQAIAQAQDRAKPGIREYALEAELIAEYTRQGATSAWPSIVAAGRNATVIHYGANSATLSAGDLVLIDTGAEYGYYTADISRTFAVSGEFKPRQQAVYDAVKRAQAAGIAAHKPGATLLEIDAVMQAVLADAVKSLGLGGPLREYYPHMSHHLGLDVHDTGSPRLALEPGMVVTCEPGLYLREEGIGVRLEDDILITESGHEVLS
jgi:Xaa-Pro aminopeptidase